jgi:hypothetical protein
MLVFIVLKLTRYINWSWWWILAPAWISAVLTVLFFIMVLFSMAMRPARSPRRPF